MKAPGKKAQSTEDSSRPVRLFAALLFLIPFMFSPSVCAQPTNPIIRPFESIAAFLSTAAQLPTNQLVALTNESVVYSNAKNSIFIQDRSGGLLAIAGEPAPFNVGDIVNVTGEVFKGGYSYFLRNCRFAKTGAGTVSPPMQLSATELLTGNFDMRLVQVEGRLETEVARAGDVLQFNLRNGTVFFRAELIEPGSRTVFENLVPDCVVRLTGICSVGSQPGARPSTFRILLRSPADLQLVRPPPAWTLNRILILLGIVSVIAVAALAWVYSLRYQVRRNTEAIQILNENLARSVDARTAQLAQANKELEAFSYSISHDLKAPVRAIRNFSQFLAEDYAQVLPAEGHRLVKLINEGAQRMDRLIEDLLLFSRLSRAPLRRQTIDLNALLQDCFNEARAAAPDRVIEFHLKDLASVVGDPALLKQVFLNLFSNAIKYTRPRAKAFIEAGPVEIKGERAIYIKDNGVGFDMKYVNKLFGVFQRLHSVEEFEGTGAGLAIVQQIIRRHGGRVWAESILNQGATFYVVLDSGDKV